MRGANARAPLQHVLRLYAFELTETSPASSSSMNSNVLTLPPSYSSSVGSRLRGRRARRHPSVVRTRRTSRRSPAARIHPAMRPSTARRARRSDAAGQRLGNLSTGPRPPRRRCRTPAASAPSSRAVVPEARSAIQCARTSAGTRRGAAANRPFAGQSLFEGHDQPVEAPFFVS